MKRKLITLSIVSILTTAYASAPVLAQSLPPELSPNKPPGAPPELPDHPEHIHKTGDTLDIPDELIQHRQNFDQTKSEEKPDEASTPALPLEEDKVLEDEQVPKQWRSLIKQGGQKRSKRRNLALPLQNSPEPLISAEKIEDALRLKAITLKRLGLGYTGRKQFQARNYLGKQLQPMASSVSRTAAKARRGKLEKMVQELDFPKFGDRVSGYFADAKVERISVFRRRISTYRGLSGRQTGRDLNSEKVKKIKFDKMVSFNFKALPEDKFGLDHGSTSKNKEIMGQSAACTVGLNSNQQEASNRRQTRQEKTVTIAVPDGITISPWQFEKELKTQ
ncbi:MAG: hypothetical protein R3C24_06340 [Cyanobacteriota/Melainabacteria group bacterium]